MAAPRIQIVRGDPINPTEPIEPIEPIDRPSHQPDPAKVPPMIQAYVDVISGALPRDQLPAINDLVRDDALADMSIRPKAGLDGKSILEHMCAMRHNAMLDHTISRARFDVTRLSACPRDLKDEAIRRLMLEQDAAHMPPTGSLAVAWMHGSANCNQHTDPEAVPRAVRCQRDLVIDELMQ